MRCALPIILLATAAACSTVVYAHSAWNQRMALGLREHDELVTLSLAVPAAATELQTEVEVDCAAGCARLQLRDPDGRTRWQQVLERGDSDQRFVLPARPGTWTLELALVNFTGGYSTELWAHDEPAVRVELRPAPAAHATTSNPAPRSP